MLALTANGCAARRRANHRLGRADNVLALPLARIGFRDIATNRSSRVDGQRVGRVTLLRPGPPRTKRLPCPDD